jgi:glycosyltransferase involved in cell wall biosynthesis
VDELVAALERVISARPDQRDAMGRAGRAKVEAEFAVEPVTHELLEVFGEMLPVPFP